MRLLGRRRRFLVDRFQYSFLVTNLCYLGTLLFLFAVAIFAPAIRGLHSASSWQEAERAANEFLSLHGRVWPVMLVALVVVSLHSILVSHRVAGPLYRFRKVFDSIRQGNLSVKAGVRKRDYLRGDADSINEMILGLVGRMRGIEHELSRAQAAFRELEAGTHAERPQRLTRLLGGLDDRLRALEGQVRLFRLPGPEFGGPPPATFQADAMDESAHADPSSQADLKGLADPGVTHR